MFMGACLHDFKPRRQGVPWELGRTYAGGSKARAAASRDVEES